MAFIEISSSHIKLKQIQKSLLHVLVIGDSRNIIKRQSNEKATIVISI